MTTEARKLKKSRNRYRIVLALTWVLLLVCLSVILLHWDYILFKAFLSQRYIHTDALDEIYKEQLGMDISGNYFRYFDNLAIALISQELRETAKDPYTFIYNPREYQEYREHREISAAESYLEELTPDTVYLYLSNFTDQSLAFFHSSIGTLSLYDNLILDLRGNGGGDLDIMLAVSEVFVPQNHILMIEKSRRGEKAIMSKKASALSFSNIVILQDGGTASASELLILALKENLANVTTAGEKTFGKSVGQTTLELLRGFQTRITTLMFLSPIERSFINNTGILPHLPHPEEGLVEYVLNWMQP